MQCRMPESSNASTNYYPQVWGDRLGNQIVHALIGIGNSCNVSEPHHEYCSTGQPCQIYTAFVLCYKNIAIQFHSTTLIHTAYANIARLQQLDS